jgi:hypothetical protein
MFNIKKPPNILFIKGVYASKLPTLDDVVENKYNNNITEMGDDDDIYFTTYFDGIDTTTTIDPSHISPPPTEWEKIPTTLTSIELYPSGGLNVKCWSCPKICKPAFYSIPKYFRSVQPLNATLFGAFHSWGCAQFYINTHLGGDLNMTRQLEWMYNFITGEKATAGIIPVLDPKKHLIEYGIGNMTLDEWDNENNKNQKLHMHHMEKISSDVSSKLTKKPGKTSPLLTALPSYDTANTLQNSNFRF